MAKETNTDEKTSTVQTSLSLSRDVSERVERVCAIVGTSKQKFMQRSVLKMVEEMEAKLPREVIDQLAALREEFKM